MFADRKEAGEQLAAELKDCAGEETIVLAIPRGGVVVGYEVARRLQVPLDIVVPRKLRAPRQPELAIGAVTEDGNIFLEEAIVDSLGVFEEYIREESERQRSEIERRLRVYKGETEYPDLTGWTVILVDDGVATGATMKAALASVRKRTAGLVVIAIPVSSARTLRELRQVADQVVCLSTPEPFFAIGQFYRDFSQTSDEEVTKLLEESRKALESLSNKDVNYRIDPKKANC